MDAQQPGTFDKKAFIAAVKAAIEAKSPKTLKEADNYKSPARRGGQGRRQGSGRPGQRGPGQGHRDSHRSAAGPVEGGGQAGHADGARRSPARRVPIPAAGAVPKPAPPEQTEPRRRQAPGRPGTGRRRGLASRSWRSPTNRSSSRRDRQEGGRRARRHRAGGVPRAGEADPRAGPGRRRPPRPPPGRGRHAGPPRARRWRNWWRTRARPRPRTRPSAPRSPARSEQIFTATETDVKKILDGIDPKVDKAFEERRGDRQGRVRDLRRGEDVGLQEGPLRRLAGRVAVGEGQAASGCPTRSTSSTRPVASCTSSRWTG